MGGANTCNAHRNSGGVEGYFCVQKMEIPGKRGGGGMNIFWNDTMWSILLVIVM